MKLTADQLYKKYIIRYDTHEEQLEAKTKRIKGVCLFFDLDNYPIFGLNSGNTKPRISFQDLVEQNDPIVQREVIPWTTAKTILTGILDFPY